MISTNFRDLKGVWRADRLDARPTDVPGHATGCASLDAELPDGGWPSAGMVELLCPGPLGAEWSLLAPWLRRPVDDQASSILGVSPPHDLYAPGLTQIGLKAERLLLVRVGNPADAAWAAEQALQIGSCQAIIWWASAHVKEINTGMLRRIHLAGLSRHAPIFVIRPLKLSLDASPAPLRLKLERRNQKLVVTVIKRRGPPMTRPIEIDLPVVMLDTNQRMRVLATSKLIDKPRQTPSLGLKTLTNHAVARNPSARLVA